MKLKYIFIIALSAVMVSCGQKNQVKTAKHDHGHDNEEAGDEIVLSPDKAKKYGVESIVINPQNFNKVIKVSGEILSAQGDSYLVVAPSSGTVKFANSISQGVKVNSGENICSITADKIVGGDSNEAALITLKAAKRELDRLTPLYQDKIVTEREYNAAKEAYDKAKLAYRPAGKGGNVATTSISGIITQLMVRDGEYVEAGSPIALVSKNSRLTLRADVPERYYNQIKSITSANIKTTYMDDAIALNSLNGKLISSTNSPAMNGYIPLFFEFDNNNQITSGSFAEIYLLGSSISNALVVPVSAITEELGSSYIFVQVDDECYDKRTVKLGETDGDNIQIIEGLKSGEKVVTKGVSFVKLAGNTSEVPEGCSHNH